MFGNIRGGGGGGGGSPNPPGGGGGGAIGIAPGGGGGGGGGGAMPPITPGKPGGSPCCPSGGGGSLPGGNPGKPGGRPGSTACPGGPGGGGPGGGGGGGTNPSGIGMMLGLRVCGFRRFLRDPMALALQLLTLEVDVAVRIEAPDPLIPSLTLTAVPSRLTPSRTR
jgi:hypothetical protein